MTTRTNHLVQVAVTTGNEELIHEYLNRVQQSGLQPITLSQPGQSLADCAGLVLTGGVDISPARYQEPAHPMTQKPNLARDDLEFAVLEEALERDLPVFAICRGLQLLNVALGGSLEQHIGWSHSRLQDEARTSARHMVSASGILRDLWRLDRVEVNSRHHQALTLQRLAPALEVVSMSDDGYVEAAVYPERRWVVGVQWHPEREDAFIPGFDSRSRQLFDAFARAAANR